LQKRTQVQWDIDVALGADDGVDESTSPRAGLTPPRLGLVAQTLLTVLTQNSPPEEIARHGASSILGLGKPPLTGRVRCDAAESEPKDIAKYFVPASIIRKFIPAG
jgi:hypothetical protein